MKTTTFKALSEKEQKNVLGGKLPGGSPGIITGWRYYNGIYYVDISYDAGDPSCDVPWGPDMPQIGGPAT